MSSPHHFFENKTRRVSTRELLWNLFRGVKFRCREFALADSRICGSLGVHRAVATTKNARAL